MASTYSPSLRIELMATGDQSGTWGDTTNTNLGTLLEQSITGYLAKAMADANQTLTNLNGASDEARNMIVEATGALTGTKNVVVPTAEKLYLFKNSTTGGFAVTIKTSAGTGVAVAMGQSQWVYCDGTNVVQGLTGLGSPDTNSNVSANNFLAGYTTTATAAGTTTLTVASTEQQYFTGATTQTVVLPVVSTLVLGQSFEITNRSTGNLTVNSSGANLVATVFPGMLLRVVVVAITGTSETSWSAVLTSVTATAAQQLAATATTPFISPSNLAAERLLAIGPSNFGLAVSVAASALTIELVGASGSAASATNPVTVPFRNVTAGTGTPSNLTVASSTTLVISSGSTMGFTSAVAGRLWIVGFNDGGTFRLGAVNCLSGVNIMALRDGIYSSTAEGGAGGADTAQVIYTGTAVTSKALTILGYLEATEATAGTWATAPSLVKMLTAGVSLPGEIVQKRRTDTGTMATGTTTVPLDGSIPQSTEGDQYMSQAITPIAAVNVLDISAQAIVSPSGGSAFFACSLFQDSVANALKTGTDFQATAGGINTLTVSHSMIAGTAAAITFKTRVGSNVAGTNTFNGLGGVSFFGGGMNSYMEVLEFMA